MHIDKSPNMLIQCIYFWKYLKSFTWGGRSIMKSVNIVAGGVRHLIGNEKSTRIREDLWASMTRKRMFKNFDFRIESGWFDIFNSNSDKLILKINIWNYLMLSP